LQEALDPLRAALAIGVKQKRWLNAAIRASNLSELELTLGAVAGAVGDAEQSVTYADRSGDAFWKMGTRTTHADALHQAGRRAEAETRFREAEQMQAERQPDYPLLYSLQGFRYCDLLLAAPERAAWQSVLPHPGPLPEGEGVLVACRAVSERGKKMFEWRVPGDPLLDIALDHLTLGRAALYEAIQANANVRGAQPNIEQAVAGLRRAGQQYYLPLGILTRAWLRFLTGVKTGPESAQADLDEAWEIAERGPMRLFLADIHLHRARLFFREPEYLWESPQADLDAARKLIEDCGYWRRKEELEDAEAVILRRNNDAG
jgi:hypothetical protein